ncbi:MAG: hypothetical protein H6839_12900 [Planctomycetes bacterium]|nr:hypothetical protein [Planctomycetota bacterium]
MLRYVVSNLGPETPQANQDKLLAALKTIKGIKDIALVPARKEIAFGINGPEPKAKLLKEACATAGFTLGSRM